MSSFIAVVALAMASQLPQDQQQSHNPQTHAATPAVQQSQPVPRANFQAAMRKLWEDHVLWTRLYIVSAAAGLPDLQPTAERLLRNQADIGHAIAPFYGAAAGDKLTALLRPHILIAAELITAAKAGNNAAVESASSRWYANANEIADFLSAANAKNWPRETMRAEMRNHLDLTLKEAQARLKGDWIADIAAYDAVREHILGMADVLSKGIIAQFPQRFR
jgi:hypothetical protein